MRRSSRPQNSPVAVLGQVQIALHQVVLQRVQHLIRVIAQGTEIPDGLRGQFGADVLSAYPAKSYRREPEGVPSMPHRPVYLGSHLVAVHRFYVYEQNPSAQISTAWFMWSSTRKLHSLPPPPGSLHHQIHHLLVHALVHYMALSGSLTSDHRSLPFCNWRPAPPTSRRDLSSACQLYRRSPLFKLLLLSQNRFLQAAHRTRLPSRWSFLDVDVYDAKVHWLVVAGLLVHEPAPLY